jgi:hypothetical protein
MILEKDKPATKEDIQRVIKMMQSECERIQYMKNLKLREGITTCILLDTMCRETNRGCYFTIGFFEL